MLKSFRLDTILGDKIYEEVVDHFRNVSYIEHNHFTCPHFYFKIILKWKLNVKQ